MIVFVVTLLFSYFGLNTPHIFLKWLYFSPIDYDFLYHYWNPLNDQFENISIAQLFRSDYSSYSDTKLPDPPSTNLYTGISLGPAFALFWILFIVYGLIITRIKRKISSDFKSSSFLKKFQVRNIFNQLINHSSGRTNFDITEIQKNISIEIKINTTA